MIAAIVLGAGLMVEIYAVLLAPMGYQDTNGFHAVTDGADDGAGSRVKNPG